MNEKSRVCSWRSLLRASLAFACLGMIVAVGGTVADTSAGAEAPTSAPATRPALNLEVRARWIDLRKSSKWKPLRVSGGANMRLSLEPGNEQSSRSGQGHVNERGASRSSGRIKLLNGVFPLRAEVEFKKDSDLQVSAEVEFRRPRGEMALRSSNGSAVLMLWWSCEGAPEAVRPVASPIDSRSLGALEGLATIHGLNEGQIVCWGPARKAVLGTVRDEDDVASSRAILSIFTDAVPCPGAPAMDERGEIALQLQFCKSAYEPESWVALHHGGMASIMLSGVSPAFYCRSDALIETLHRHVGKRVLAAEVLGKSVSVYASKDGAAGESDGSVSMIIVASAGQPSIVELKAPAGSDLSLRADAQRRRCWLVAGGKGGDAVIAFVDETGAWAAGSGRKLPDWAATDGGILLGEHRL